MSNIFRKMFGWIGHARSRRPSRQSSRFHRRQRIAALVLLLLLAGLCLTVWYSLADERIRTHAIKAIERFTGGEVELEQASLAVLRQIRVKGLRLYLPGRKHIEENLVFAARDVILEHHPWSLIQKQLRVKYIVADNARLHVRYDLDRRITNLQLLSFLKRPLLGPDRPTITLRNAVLDYTERQNGKDAGRALQEFSGRLYPSPLNPRLYEFDLTSADRGVFQNSSLHGKFHTESKQLTTNGTFLLGSVSTPGLPPRLRSWRRWYEQIRPQGQLQIESTFDPRRGHRLRLTLDRGECLLPLDPNSPPLPLKNVNLAVNADQDGITIDQISGEIEPACRLQGRGSIKGYSPPAAFDLNLSAQQVWIPHDQWNHLDPNRLPVPEQIHPEYEKKVLSDRLSATLNALYKRLPASGKEGIHFYFPTGGLDLQIHLWGRRDRLEEAHYEGRLHFTNAAFRQQKFPYPIRNVQGKITFDPNHVLIGPLHAEFSGQTMDMQGKFALRDQDPCFTFEIDWKNTPFDRTLYNALDVSTRRVWDQFNPAAGRMDVTYRYNRLPGQAPRQSVDLILKQVRASYEGFPLPLRDVRGAIRWRREKTTFNITHAASLHGTLQLQGELDRSQPSRPRLSCRGQYRDFRIDPNFARFVPAPLRDDFRRLNLTTLSDGDFEWLFTPSTASSAERPFPSFDPNRPADLHYRIKFRLRDGRLRWEKFPLPLQHVRAEGELTDRRVRLDSFTAAHDASTLNLTGTIHPTDQIDLHLVANRFRFDDTFARVLPDRLRRFYERLEPEGTLDLQAHLTCPAEPAQSNAFRLEGQTELNHTRLRLPLRIHDFNGRIRGSLELDRHFRHITLAARVRESNLNVLRYPLSGFSCDLVFDDNRNEIVLSDISGDFCRGRLAGELRADLDPNQSGYQLRLQFLDGNLPDLFDWHKQPPQTSPPVRGRFSGSFNLDHEASGEKRGRFNVTIREGVLGQLPLIAQVLHVINLQLPRAGAFNEAELYGDILGDKIVFDPIQLRGSAVSLTGVGLMNGPFFKTDASPAAPAAAFAESLFGTAPLELVFVVDAPRYLPDLPLLSSFYRAIRGELVQVRVSGSFADPQVEPVAFPTLGDALRTLDQPR